VTASCVFLRHSVLDRGDRFVDVLKQRCAENASFLAAEYERGIVAGVMADVLDTLQSSSRATTPAVASSPAPSTPSPLPSPEHSDDGAFLV
jgi:hypothetical protein